ncbi:MAG: hypothetical protein HY644_13090 [Acidobacteria bacterium]|nr:hypothetical protein [Acidobacteriota bacterium]
MAILAVMWIIVFALVAIMVLRGSKTSTEILKEYRKQREGERSDPSVYERDPLPGGIL